jgi:Mg-chelatase subunit ChlD
MKSAAFLSRTTLAALIVALVWALSHAPALGGDVLQDYKKRTKGGFLSDREEVIQELAALGDPKAVRAIRWCIEHTRKELAKAEKAAEKAFKVLDPLIEETVEKQQKWAEGYTKKGLKPPDRRPKWPVDDKRMKAKAEADECDRKVKREKEFLASALDAHGRIVSQLEAPAQEKIRVGWEKELTSKEWTERAGVFGLLGSTPTDWAYVLLTNGAVSEPDPRVLIVIIDALGGRDPSKVLPIFEERLKDPRWLVRSATIAALEKTPSRETIDLLLDRLEVEEGRLQDDCARALRALTGADLRTDHDLWKRYWEANREKWTGPPEPEPEEEDLDPEKEWERQLAKSKDRTTGFFGIETKSRRLVYVIDVSGSMNEPVEKDSKVTRADRAKDELVRTIRALEDGASFNIIFFAAEVHTWQKEMATASSETRRSAEEFIVKMNVGGGTNAHDALDRAFLLADEVTGKKRGPDGTGDAKVDTIVFLSDGKPSRGRITATDALRAAVREWNKTRKITIHCVAFGKDSDVDFLKGMAEDSGGTFLAK